MKIAVRSHLCAVLGLATFLLLSPLHAQTPTVEVGDHGTYYEIRYLGSARPDELIYDSIFTLWVPEGAEPLRGVIVHQHGCGINPTKFGHMIAYDQHWQELARKWHCALLGPSFLMTKETDNCFKWCDPRNGSDQVFLRALEDFSAASHRPELAKVPWALWGHSGGGSWISIMQMLHPERIIAVFFRSGSAFPHWSDGRIPKVEIPAAAMEIPMMCAVGGKEKDDPKYHDGYLNPLKTFLAYRAAGAPVAFAPDPLNVHGCGDSRYLSIPFFDACLELRLPPVGSDPTKLKPIQQASGWLAPLLGSKAVPAGDFHGEMKDSVWLPNAKSALAWSEFVQTGGTHDTTPPPAPTDLHVTRTDAGVALTWDARIDLESGLQQFIIERDGHEIGRLPEKPAGRFGRPLYQSMSGWDTPNARATPMAFVDQTPGADIHGSYHVVAVNSVGLKSP
jgi:hypothetical protein